MHEEIDGNKQSRANILVVILNFAFEGLRQLYCVITDTYVAWADWGASYMTLYWHCSLKTN